LVKREGKEGGTTWTMHIHGQPTRGGPPAWGYYHINLLQNVTQGLTQNWHVLVNVVMNLWNHWKMGNFLT